MIRLGLVLFALGVALIAVELIGFAVGARDFPLWLDLLCGVLAPAGFIVAIASAIRAGRADQRAAFHAVADLRR
jgi:uncharacterized membrane protein YhdT